jgi:hypothetical protein
MAVLPGSHFKVQHYTFSSHVAAQYDYDCLMGVPVDLEGDLKGLLSSRTSSSSSRR